MVFELFWWNVNDQNQVSVGQLFWHVVGTVQSIPFTFSVVASLVTVAISVVIFTVLIIEGAETDTERLLFIVLVLRFLRTQRVYVWFFVLTCIDLLVPGSQSHHKGNLGCCTGHHTSRH